MCEGYDNIVFYNGGYSAKLCLTSTFQNIFANHSQPFSCSRTNDSCEDGGGIYLCSLPCKFNISGMIGSKATKVKYESIPSFTITSSPKEKVYDTNDTITMDTKTDLSLIQKKELQVMFYKESAIVCPILEVTPRKIVCGLDLSKRKEVGKVFVNVSVRYGYEHCGNIIQAGLISVERPSPLKRWIRTPMFWKTCVIIFVVIILISGLIFILKIRTWNKSATFMNMVHKKQLEDQEIRYVNTQKKAFLEYQTAVGSFSDLGSLTPRHVLNFYNYTSRIFNLELSLDSSITNNHKLEDFREILLNKDKLINYIERIEKEAKLQQRSVVASLLTIILFQHPTYFLEIIRTLLINSVKKMKDVNEERILFRRSEAIVEKLVGNWISLCMYQSLKGGEIGKRFFNLYRAIKCKMNQGIVDCISKKAKYTLTFDHIMLGDIDYETLNIKADIDVTLKLMNSTSPPVKIHLTDLEVQVLSLDSISQVEEKILDKAIMVYAENEKIKCEENEDLCFDMVDQNELQLQFTNNTTKIMLADHDFTSITSDLDKNCVLINTMKHYNMKSGMRFLLTSVTILDNINTSSTSPRSPTLSTKIHLQLPQDHKPIVISEKQNDDFQPKIRFNPVAENMNKEAYLMRLLATKQSIIPFIDGFIQCLFDFNPNKIQGISSNSLFDGEERPLVMSSLNILDSENSISKEMYLVPVSYLFIMLDEIANLLQITDPTTISLWKSNSFILRFWINMIKNPNFIFCVDKIGPIDGGLTTVATVLMESCSVFSNTLVDVNLPIVKQLFIKELKEYSSWWKSFTETSTIVEEKTIVKQMENIIQTYDMAYYYNSSITSLHAITSAILPELVLLEDMSQDSQ